jgi:hypothetical protein
MRLVLRRRRKPRASIWLGVIPVRGGNQRRQRANRQRDLRDSLQRHRHGILSSTGMLSGQIARINSRSLHRASILAVPQCTTS